MEMLQSSAHQKIVNLLTTPPGKMFCPRQDSLDDIKVNVWKISNGFQGWCDVHDALKRRQISLSPFTIIAQGKTIPVTPLRNRKIKMSSHFIIRMEDDEDARYRVNCLFRDVDMYFMGFQRELILSPEELQIEEQKRLRKAAVGSSMQKKVFKGRLPGQGDFYIFSGSDMKVPGFLNGKKMNNLGGGYTAIPKLGGTEVVRHIFHVFSRYQDGIIPEDELLSSCSCLMALVSEPSRLGSWYNEVSRRMAAEETQSPLSDFFWEILHNWTQLSKMVLQRRLINRLASHYLLPEWCQRHKLKVTQEAIGERGELLLIRIDSSLIGIAENKLKEIEAAAIKVTAGPADRLDPGFD